MGRGARWDLPAQVIAGGQWTAWGRRGGGDNAARRDTGRGIVGCGIAEGTAVIEETFPSSLVLVRHVWGAVSASGLLSTETGRYGRESRRGHEVEDGVEHLCFVRKGSGSWAGFSLEKTERGISLMQISISKASARRMVPVFSVVRSERMRNNKLNHKKFLRIMKNFTLRGGRALEPLPGENWSHSNPLRRCPVSHAPGDRALEAEGLEGMTSERE